MRKLNGARIELVLGALLMQPTMHGNVAAAETISYSDAIEVPANGTLIHSFEEGVDTFADQLVTVDWVDFQLALEGRTAVSPPVAFRQTEAEAKRRFHRVGPVRTGVESRGLSYVDATAVWEGRMAEVEQEANDLFTRIIEKQRRGSGVDVEAAGQEVLRWVIQQSDVVAGFPDGVTLTTATEQCDDGSMARYGADYTDAYETEITFQWRDWVSVAMLLRTAPLPESRTHFNRADAAEWVAMLNRIFERGRSFKHTTVEVRNGNLVVDFELRNRHDSEGGPR